MAYLLYKYVAPQDLVIRVLRGIPGVGTHQARQLCDEIGVSVGSRVIDVSLEDWDRLQSLITSYYHAGNEVSRRRMSDIRRHIRMGTYRGFRHVSHLPVRGQRTHTNGRSRRRSPRVSM